MARADAEDQQQELDALRLTAAEHGALQTRWAQEVRSAEAQQVELATLRNSLTQEREHRQEAQANAIRAVAQLETLQQLLDRFRPHAPSEEPITSAKE